MTMVCTEALDLLLEADVEELEGLGETALSVHVRTCRSCRVEAERILRVQAMLAEALDTAAASIAPEVDPTTARVAGRPRRGVRWRVLLPLAAAAIGVMTLVPREPGPPLPSPFLGPPAWASSELRIAGERPFVQSDLHENIAVLPTENPDITVIWFMD